MRERKREKDDERAKERERERETDSRLGRRAKQRGYIDYTIGAFTHEAPLSQP